MLDKINLASNSRWYWIFLLFTGITLEASALFYQYVLGEPPCVLCIHVRIWVLGMVSLSLLALILRKFKAGLLAAHILMTLIMTGLFERSYQLLGVERGFIFGSCSMDSGLPPWFSLDSWLPYVFKIWAACGYTPELLFGITMAEALIVLSAVLFLISCILTIGLIVSYLRKA
ncbi:Periplasmic thiol:disulfide oxidoreductase DsbB, required for DsbA reoxidation [hydrothermal vent metagenome]|uniref:Periplasmic thiol:disulfide oxidoreductase DsbB, required for DsbA reoxidation n=1 Tax=hydrothermal vent metagenome TaxID=652676 RepID=A0A3B0X7H6_9ZZZZ